LKFLEIKKTAKNSGFSGIRPLPGPKQDKKILKTPFFFRERKLLLPRYVEEFVIDCNHLKKC